MSNDLKRTRSKKFRSSKHEHGNRQAMSDADWPTKPSRSRDLDIPRLKRDANHQERKQDEDRSRSEASGLGDPTNSVVPGGSDAIWLPPSDERLTHARTADNRPGPGHRAGSVQLDGARDEEEGRLNSEEYVASHGQVRVLPSATSGIHPDRVQFLHQSLIDQINERLGNEGLSPKTIADLLARNNLVPLDTTLTHTTTLPTSAGIPQDTVSRDSGAKNIDQQAGAHAVHFKALSLANAEMSPGILVPRNAGIKIRGIEEEPPLVDAPAPDKSKIVVASQYLFQHDLEAAGLMNERDVQGRLQGIQVIEAGRRGLRMPMKTYGTACVFFMRYRYHVATKGADDDIANRYDFRDAALASLWLASKAEETPKKSKEILCAFRNSTLPPEEHLTPDDEMFENQAKLMINLERYLLEIVAFDFRARNCGELLAGLMVDLSVSEKVVKIAMAVTLDIYRTLAVLKQTRQTLALSCFEMAARFVQSEEDASKATDKALYEKLGTTRQEVLETLFDLIELYLNHHVITAAGSKYNINDFMRVSTALRSEMKASGYARYTYIQEVPPSTSPTTSPIHTDAKSTPTLHGTPRTPANRDADRRDSIKKRTSPKENQKILVDERDIEIGKPVSPPPSFLLSRESNGYGTQSPTSPTSPTTAEAVNPDDPSQVKEVVRFVLDASRARDEDLLRRPFHQIETVEVAEQKNLWIPKDGSVDQSELEAATLSPTSPPHVGKMRNGDVEMRDAPASSAPSGPRGLRDMPPMGPRGDRDRDRDRDDRRDRERDRDRERRRSPPPSRMYGRDDRYARRDDRRW